MPFTRTDEGANIVITCTGGMLAECFLSAAHGLFDVLADGSKIRGEVRQEIVIQAETIDSLFREWLKELIARVQQTSMLYSDFEIFSIQRANAKQYVLTGAIYGETYDEGRHTRGQKISLDEKSAICKEGSGKSECSFVLVR